MYELDHDGVLVYKGVRDRQKSWAKPSLRDVPETMPPQGTVVSWVGTFGTIWYGIARQGRVWDPFVIGSICCIDILGERDV